ncbi:MAG: hypothetical protein IJK49_08235 [Prevotella sp.]|nr:hypothetical protein [Prevotella sp.]
MKKVLLISFVFVFFANHISAKSSVGDVYISVYVPEDIDIPQESVKLLDSKMHQMISSNGLIDTDPNGRFVMKVRSNILSKDIIGGAPQQVSQKVELTFMIGDAIENKVFDSYSYTTTGIGINENKSFINAISKIKVNAPQIMAFIENAKERIVDFYSTRCEQIILESEQQAAGRNYQQAIYMLMQVPSICDCSETCQKRMVEYYDAYTETTALSLLNEAKSKWASSPNASGAAEAANIIETIPAGTSIQVELDRFINEINLKLQRDEKREWEFKMRQYNDKIANQKREYQLRRRQQEADIAYREKQQSADNAYRRQEQIARDERMKMTINACRQIGLAYAMNYQPPTYYIKNIHTW